MAADRRVIRLAAITVIGIVVALVARWMYEPDAVAARGTPAAQRPRGGVVAGAEDGGPVAVNLETLTRTRGEPTEQGRNPFRFQPKPAPPPPVALPPPVLRPSDQPPGGPVTPPRPPPPPEITLKFIGMMGKIEDGKVITIAVLSDGVRTYHGVEGAMIAGQYRILKIGNESIEMAYEDGRGRKTIRLSGQ